MGKPRKGSERGQRLEALFAAGDHGGARRLAAEVLADPAAGEPEREGAAAILARTAPDRFARVAAVVGVASALVIGIWLLAH